MKKLFLASAILSAISAHADKITTKSLLSTLDEGDELITIDVDKELKADQITICLVSRVDLSQEDGKLVCSGIDQNTENTFVHISSKDEVEFEFDGEIYSSEELAANHSFHSALLNSELSSLTMETVNHLLHQILPEYARSSI